MKWTAQIKDANNEVIQLTASMGKLTKTVTATTRATGQSINRLSQFVDNLAGKWREVLRYLLSFGSLYEVINIGRYGFEALRSMDAAMVEVRKVSDETESTYESFRLETAQTAKEIASTNVELRNSAADWLRLGESIEYAGELAKNAAVYVNVGDGIDINTATKDMITAMRAFDIEAKDSISIIDAYNEVGNNFSISSAGIGEVLERSASALAVANNTFAESIALGTAMNEALQDTEVTGSALKIFSLRIRGVKSEIEQMGESTDGMVTSTAKMRAQIKALTNVDGLGGFDILTSSGDFKSTAEIAKGLGQAFEKMSDIDRAGLLELIAGKNRANAVASLLQNWETIDEVLETIADDEGSAMRENEAIVDSINGRVQILRATMEEFWAETVNSDSVKTIISGLTTMLELLTALVKTAGLLPTVMSAAAGSFLAYKGIGITIVYALHGGNSMSY